MKKYTYKTKSILIVTIVSLLVILVFETYILISKNKKDNNLNTYKEEVVFNKEENNLVLYDKDHNIKWKYSIPDNNEYQEISTINNDDKLFIAYYSKFSSGANLLALNKENGKLIWQANIKEFNIPHSEYYNEVKLLKNENQIILVGLESYGTYMQIFDDESGKSLFYTTNCQECINDN